MTASQDVLSLSAEPQDYRYGLGLSKITRELLRAPDVVLLVLLALFTVEDRMGWMLSEFPGQLTEAHATVMLE